jgi:hypothetical protein
MLCRTHNHARTRCSWEWGASQLEPALHMTILAIKREAEAGAGLRGADPSRLPWEDPVRLIGRIVGARREASSSPTESSKGFRRGWERSPLSAPKV